MSVTNLLKSDVDHGLGNKADLGVSVHHEVVLGLRHFAAFHEKMLELVVRGDDVRVELDQVGRLVAEAFFHGRRLQDLGDAAQVATLVVVQGHGARHNLEGVGGGDGRVDVPVVNQVPHDFQQFFVGSPWKLALQGTSKHLKGEKNKLKTFSKRKTIKEIKNVLS